VKKIRVLIIQGFPEVVDALHAMIADEVDLVLLGKLQDGHDGLRAIREHRPHLVFLGIRLSGMNGFEVLEAAGADAPRAVIFVSVYDRYAVRAFSVDAVDYLLKPFTRDRFREAVQRARWRLDEPLVRRNGRHAPLDSAAPKAIGIRSNGRIVLLRPREIEMVVGRRTGCVVHTGAATHRVNSALASLQKKLPPEKFVRINRSTLVNAASVEAVVRKGHGDGLVRLKGGQMFPLSRRYRSQWSGFLSRTSRSQEKRSSFQGSAVLE
jgi:two-component system LytT family response regulator